MQSANTLEITRIDSSTSQSLRLIGVALFAPVLNAQQAALAPIAGCYRVEIGTWSRELGVNAAYHAVPSIIRLDTIAAARGRTSRFAQHCVPRRQFLSWRAAVGAEGRQR